MKKLKIILVIFVLILGVQFVCAEDTLNVDGKNVFETVENKLKKIDFDLRGATEKFQTSKEQILYIEQNLRPLKDKRATLETQLKIFEDQILLTETKIQNIEIQINQKRLEIAKLQEIIERAKIETVDEKQLVLDFIKEMYFEEKKNYKRDSATPELIKLLLSEKSVSRSLKEIEYLSLMESLSRNIFNRLENAIEVFNLKKEELENKKSNLNSLKNDLQDEKLNLIAERDAREKLFEDTKGKEETYQYLLSQSKEEYKNALISINSLQDNKEYIKTKLSQLNIDSFTESKNKRTQLLKEMLENPINDYNLGNIVSDQIFTSQFMWPVSPEKGLSAYFMDPDYEKYFGVKHYAIDIKIRQGTPVFAPASGYVQEVKFDGNKYSYVIIIHKDGFSTLYGHLSEILVKEDELVQLGSIIGKSGGMPGTKGAGLMTTGPHLHFEVYKDGKAVNPLNYVPLEFLPVDYRELVKE